MANLPHIAVCICTYRRLAYLARLLDALATQETENLFTYSIVIADNDAARSAESIVNKFANSTSLQVTYCVQPTQNIALARNDALAQARGDLIAFIDDDEVPISNWLLLLFQACEKCRADGVVGSVKPNFEVEPPSWVVKGRFCERETYKTGTVLKWPQGRTGNLLFKKEILETLEPPFFRAEFLTAEDQDFFRRAIERGNVFVWCDEAVAYEEVSSVRWNRGFMLKRALLRGKISLQHPTSRLRAVLTSFVAVPLYAMVLPFSALFGKHVFTSYLIRSFDHIGRILGFLKVAALPRTYVTESRAMSTPTEKARRDTLAGPDDLILITGGSGFIGRKVVENLQARGFRRIRCLTRSRIDSSLTVNSANGRGELEVMHGNLLSCKDCARAVQGATVVYHLAAARGEKSFSDAYMNSVVTTKNLLNALVHGACVRRFVNVSSFTVYTKRSEVLDESCPIEEKPALRGEAYCFAKCRQEEIVRHYGRNHRVPYVILRPGHVYGPGNEGISSRVGIGTFGIFLHLGGSNRVPLSYVDNCADAIVRAGITPGIDGEIINVVDDDLPTSREFLRMYKKYVRHFHSVYLPQPISYMLCALWENYSNWSKGQLPPAYNRRIWYAYWKHGRFSNAKLKQLLQWSPLVTTAEGLNRYFQSCREKNTLCLG